MARCFLYIGLGVQIPLVPCSAALHTGPLSGWWHLVTAHLDLADPDSLVMDTFNIP